MINFFNEISRSRTIEIINTHFPYLSGTINLLIKDPTKVFFQKPNGGWNHFHQIEGLPQGCPLSPVCASLILNSILTDLDMKLRERAKLRKIEENFLMTMKEASPI